MLGREGGKREGPVSQICQVLGFRIENLIMCRRIGEYISLELFYFTIIMLYYIIACMYYNSNSSVVLFKP